MLATGVLLGFGAALSQSVSYLCSRLFTAKYGGQALKLLALSHIIIGIWSVAALALAWHESVLNFKLYIWPVLACMVFYLIGQWSLFSALKSATASRVSPLLGLKVFMLGMIGVFIFQQHFTFQQWVAIAMTVLAGAILSWTGDKLPVKSMLWILLACATFSISDLSIKILMNKFEHLGFARATVLSSSLTYILCGLIATAILPFVGRASAGQWAWSVPFAAAWFISMLCLFACFGFIGVVYGNIIQSTRGIISMLLAPVMVWTGFEHLEHRIGRGLFYRRLAAAVLMTGAIALYQLGK